MLKEKMSERVRYSPLEYAFEGTDGVGKTTSIRKLERYYQTTRGYKVTVFSVFSDSLVGNILRTNMGRLNEMGVRGVKLIKYDISRTYRQEVDADLVFWDRHIPSIAAANHQAWNMATVRQIPPLVPEPPKIFFLNMPPELAYERAIAITDHPISLKLLIRKHRRYLQLVQAEPARFCVIDATGSPEEVLEQLIAVIDEDLVGSNLPCSS